MFIIYAKRQQKILITTRHNISHCSKYGEIGQKQVPLCHSLVTVLAEFARCVLLFSTLFFGTHVHFTMELPYSNCSAHSD